ncbi:Uncharacterised protein [uncultured archaeon]|nr:Uncharacterised protein [uncultured archaeon]
MPDFSNEAYETDGRSWIKQEIFGLRMLTELEKIKVLILPDGQKITTEITKKQREILDDLNMCA